MISTLFKPTCFSFLMLLLTLLLSSCKESVAKKSQDLAHQAINKEDNTLSDSEINKGWKLLFDGKTFDGWRGMGRNDVQNELWKIDNGTIRKLNSEEVAPLPDGKAFEGGDLITIKTYANYELYFEWKILKAGNTGLKYNVSEAFSQKHGSQYSALGFEYQLLDDADTLYAGKLKPTQYTGSLYDMVPPKNAKTNPVGTFNSSRILINGNHAEHWLNGIKVLEYEFGSKHLDSLFKMSKYNDYRNFIDKRSGHIVLQNHKDDAWFKNIKIREITPSPK
ncbi:DUF1080 domain-containing protein [uncultured Kriegella sp.]|uniref:3-keto-disaccharide hydrolase n=1 Tax=uncultured Kriegella sp. TaxID=1798910 RepID=UPI0030DA9D3E|tara:strand:+ start:480366 stop:481199 length:834 start_codon:yes stop_codon:yes gene_type:complete